MSLLAVTCAALQIRLLGTHWINPDEGAHLMDVSMALHGLIPNLDFKARETLYVYSYVPAIYLFGPKLVVGRVMPLLAIWLTGVFVFLIGRRLWNPTCGATAALIYLCTPLILIDAPVVKTEPLCMLLTAGGVLALIIGVQEGRLRWLALSGLAFGAGFYVRQSALAGMFVAVFAFIVTTPSLRLFARRCAAFFGGTAAVVILFVAWYSFYEPVSRVLQSNSLFPPHFIYISAQKFLSSITHAKATSAAGLLDTVHGSGQSWGMTWWNVRQALMLNVPLVLGSALALLWAVYAATRSWRRREPRDPELVGVSIVIAWLAGVAALYGYYLVKRGFFQFYARELLPPMALLSAWVVYRALRHTAYAANVLLSAGLVIVAGFVVYLSECGMPFSGPAAAAVCLGGIGWMFGGRSPFRSRTYAAIFVIGVVALAVAVWAPRFFQVPIGERGSGWIYFAAATGGILVLLRICAERGPRERSFAHTVLILLAGSAMLVGSVSAPVLGPSFDCVWPTSVLRKVVPLIREHSARDDTVLSGTPIWAFEANRQPFAEVSHPLMFRDATIRHGTPERLRRDFATRPPRMIILDGYTQKTWYHVLPSLPKLIRREYKRIAKVEGGNYPVQVFLLTHPVKRVPPG